MLSEFCKLFSYLKALCMGIEYHDARGNIVRYTNTPFDPRLSPFDNSYRQTTDLLKFKYKLKCNEWIDFVTDILTSDHIVDATSAFAPFSSKLKDSRALSEFKDRMSTGISDFFSALDADTELLLDEVCDSISNPGDHNIKEHVHNTKNTLLISGKGFCDKCVILIDYIYGDYISFNQRTLCAMQNKLHVFKKVCHKFDMNLENIKKSHCPIPNNNQPAHDSHRKKKELLFTNCKRLSHVLMTEISQKQDLIDTIVLEKSKFKRHIMKKICIALKSVFEEYLQSNTTMNTQDNWENEKFCRKICKCVFDEYIKDMHEQFPKDNWKKLENRNFRGEVFKEYKAYHTSLATIPEHILNDRGEPKNEKFDHNIYKACDASEDTMGEFITRIRIE